MDKLEKFLELNIPEFLQYELDDIKYDDLDVEVEAEIDETPYTTHTQVGNDFDSWDHFPSHTEICTINKWKYTPDDYKDLVPFLEERVFKKSLDSVTQADVDAAKIDEAQFNEQFKEFCRPMAEEDAKENWDFEDLDELLENLTEASKKSKVKTTYTTGNPYYNMQMFNKKFTGNDNNNPSTAEAQARKAATDANKAAGTVAAASPDGSISVDSGSLGGDSGASGGGDGGCCEALELNETHYDPADYWDEDPNWMNVRNNIKSPDWDIINKARQQVKKQGYTDYGTASKRAAGIVDSGKFTSMYNAADAENCKVAYKNNLAKNKLDVKNFHAAYDKLIEDAGYLGLFNKNGILASRGSYGTIKNISDMHIKRILTNFWVAQFKNNCEICYESPEEKVELNEEKRYVRRYYVKPQNIFCSSKTDIINALIDAEQQDCVVYTLNNLEDNNDITKLTSNDIIYYYEDEVLYDKNHIKVMDYDLAVKHEEKRDKINPSQVSDSKFADVYHDRITGDMDEALDLDFDSYNAYGDRLVEGKEVDGECCICGEEIEGYGNNAEPVKEGRCCDACNIKFVIPARLELSAR